LQRQVHARVVPDVGNYGIDERWSILAAWILRQKLRPLHERVGRTDSIALVRLMELLFEYLTTGLNLEPQVVAGTLWRDYQRGGRKDKPAFLRESLPEAEPAIPRRGVTPLKRQSRHLAAE